MVDLEREFPLYSMMDDLMGIWKPVRLYQIELREPVVDINIPSGAVFGDELLHKMFWVEHTREVDNDIISHVGVAFGKASMFPLRWIGDTGPPDSLNIATYVYKSVHEDQAQCVLIGLSKNKSDVEWWIRAKSQIDRKALKKKIKYETIWVEQDGIGHGWVGAAEGDWKQLFPSLAYLLNPLYQDVLPAHQRVREVKVQNVLGTAHYTRVERVSPFRRREGETDCYTVSGPVKAKCEHEVRGHWRHFRQSGKKVWVRAHKRGDPNLGTVQTHQVVR